MSCIVAGTFALVLGAFCAMLVLGVRKGDGIIATAIWALLLISVGLYNVVSYATGTC